MTIPISLAFPPEEREAKAGDMSGKGLTVLPICQLDAAPHDPNPEQFLHRVWRRSFPPRGLYSAFAPFPMVNRLSFFLKNLVPLANGCYFNERV